MLEAKYTTVWLRRERLIGLHLEKSLQQRFQKLFPEPHRELKRLSRAAWFALTSHNSSARRWWFRTLGGHLCDYLGAKPPRFVPKKPVFMLTLIDSKQMVDPDLDAYGKKVNPTFHQIRSAYSRHLEGLDCLGMIDVALFVSLQRTYYVDRLMAYHCHLLVWNISEEKLQARCQAIRAKITAFVPHATAADFKPIKDGDLLQVLWYSTKAPRAQYQLQRRESRRLRQYKGAINGVNSVRLYAEMRSRTLEELTLAHGQGARVLNRALRDKRRWKRRHLKPR